MSQRLRMFFSRRADADGRVFVAIGAGNGRFVATTGAPEILPEGGQLFVFELR